MICKANFGTKMSSRQNVKAVLAQKKALDNVQWQIRHKKDLSSVCKLSFETKMDSRQFVMAKIIDLINKEFE